MIRAAEERSWLGWERTWGFGTAGGIQTGKQEKRGERYARRPSAPDLKRADGRLAFYSRDIFAPLPVGPPRPTNQPSEGGRETEGGQLSQ